MHTRVCTLGYAVCITNGTNGADPMASCEASNFYRWYAAVRPNWMGGQTLKAKLDGKAGWEAKRHAGWRGRRGGMARGYRSAHTRARRALLCAAPLRRELPWRAGQGGGIAIGAWGWWCAGRR
jgi:hypothetical protein